MAASVGFLLSTMSMSMSLVSNESPLTLQLRSPLKLKKQQQLRTLRAVTSATVSEPPSSPKVRGIMKPRQITPEMQAICGGVSEIPRTQALKHIWAYIKQHNLQDPDNKKIIICDEKLKKVFGGRDTVGMLEIAGLISPHFLK